MLLARHPVVIAAGATGLSGVVDLRDKRIVAIQMPAAWAAADLTFQGSADLPGAAGVTGTGFPTALADVYDDNDAEVVVQAAAARYITLRGATVDLLNGLAYCKIRSGTTGAPVDQTTTRTIILLTEAYAR